MTDFTWSPEEIDGFVRRIGLSPLEPEAAERLRLMAVKVSIAGHAIPRVENKDLESAVILRPPLAGADCRDAASPAPSSGISAELGDSARS